MADRGVGDAVYAAVFVADGGDDLAPAEAVEVEEVGDGVEGGAGGEGERDVVEGVDVEFAEGFGGEGNWGRAGLGEGGWGAEVAGGEGGAGVGCEEEDACDGG